jgi:O-antigen ligase
MTAIALQERLRVVALWSWGLMAFCLPFSTALTLIFSAFGVLFGLVGFDWTSFKKVIKHPISILCVALFAWLALSMLWSIAPRDEMIEGIFKYRKLLYVPLVAMLLLSARVKPWFLMNFFVAGCLLVCVGSLFSSSGLASVVLGPPNAQSGWYLGGTGEKHWFLLGPPEKPTFGRSHIAQGTFLVITVVYLTGWFIAQLRNPKVHKSNLGLSFAAIILAIYVTLNLGGLTGYVLLIMAFIIFIYFIFRAGMYKAVWSLITLALLMSVAAYSLNESTYKRVNKSVKDYVEFRDAGTLTSEGLRLTFWATGLKNWAVRPLWGWGVGSYAEVYSRDNSAPRELEKSRPQPHSEYILLIVQGGIAAIGVFLAIFWQSLCANKKDHKRVGEIPDAGQISNYFAFSNRTSIVLILIGATFNSVVWDLAEGHMTCILLAVALNLKFPIPERLA